MHLRPAAIAQKLWKISVVGDQEQEASASAAQRAFQPTSSSDAAAQLDQDRQSAAARCGSGRPLLAM